MDLYDIEKELRWLNTLATDYLEEDDVPYNRDNANIEQIKARLEALHVDREKALVAICKAIKNIEMEQMGLEEESKRLRQRAKSCDFAVGYLKEIITHSIPHGEKWASPDQLHKISWRKSTSVEIDPEVALDQKYQRITVEPNRLLIKESLSKGESIPGCSLQEKLNLQIK